MKKTEKVILISFILLCFCIVFLPAANASTLSEPSNVTKSTSLLSDVIGVNSSSYKTIVVADNISASVEYWGLSKETIIVNLYSNSSDAQAVFVFINNTFTYCTMCPTRGSILYSNQQPADTLSKAKAVIQQYGAYMGTQLLANAQNILSNVTYIGSANRTAGNLALQVVVNGNLSDFTWAKPINGVDFPTGLAVHMEKDSVGITDLSSFIRIGNSTVALSQASAVKLAMDSAQKLLAEKETNANSNQIYVLQNPMTVNLGTAYREPFTEYPFWSIILLPNKAIGGVGSIEVGIWADTGKIAYCKPFAYCGQTLNSSIVQTSTTGRSQIVAGNQLLCVFGVVSLISITSLIITTKKHPKTKARLIKLIVPILVGMLSLSFSAGAYTSGVLGYTHRATAWGTDPWYVREGDWNHTDDDYNYELYLRSLICTSISGQASETTDFEGVDHGPYTYTSTTNSILQSISDAEGNSSIDLLSTFYAGDYKVITFPDNSKLPWHAIITENNSDCYINDTQIQYCTSEKETFTFLWVCTLAHLWGASYVSPSPEYYGYGMPYAWTHSSSMNLDGYANLDQGTHCYISFESASPWLLSSEWMAWWSYATFVIDFYQLLYWGCTIKNALNVATCDIQAPGETYFSQTALYNGFYSAGMNQNDPEIWSCMRVFGNSNMAVGFPICAVTVNAVDNYNAGVPTNVYIDTVYVGDLGTYFISPGTHTIAVDDFVYNPSYDVDWYFDYFDGGSGGNPTTVIVSDDVTITAHYIFPMK